MFQSSKLAAKVKVHTFKESIFAIEMEGIPKNTLPIGPANNIDLIIAKTGCKECD